MTAARVSAQGNLQGALKHAIIVKESMRLRVKLEILRTRTLHSLGTWYLVISWA